MHVSIYNSAKKCQRAAPTPQGQRI